MYKKSEVGGKSAWKGFATQTIYIANKLISEENTYCYYPENKEDLCIKDKKNILELIQVKNYKKPLTLSDLKPELEKGFVARSILELKKDKDIKIKIICFGEIGRELIDRNKSSKDTIFKKLTKLGYKAEDIELFLSKLVIKKVDENKLKNNILDIFRANDKTRPIAEILYERLIYHIAYLSRHGGYTSVELWNSKVDVLIESIQELKILEDEYKKTIMQLSDDNFYGNYSYEELKIEYKLGADARPEHIRENLDIVREKWISKINDKLINNNIVVLKGASGQGKSSLAYRYLIDNYPENNIYVISNINDRQHAINLSKAIKSLNKDTINDVIFYMDVNPYEVDWVWLVEEINKINSNIKLLITIRHEDYNRANIKLSRDKFGEINLEFTKEEAKDVYKNIGSKKFLNFDESWKKFGGEGPFLEYIYLLNESETIEDRIRTQIKHLSDDPRFEDSWFELLSIIMNLGKFNLSTNIQELKRLIKVRNMTKLIKDLENEHFIRLIDSRNILGLHSLRSKKILQIILEETGFINEEDLLLNSIKASNENFYILIVDYFYENFSSDPKKIIVDLVRHNRTDWNYYYNILIATLWIDVYNYYTEAKNDIEKIDCDNLLLCFGDMTGLLNIEYTDIINTLVKNFSKEHKDIIDIYSDKKINFNISKFYLNKILSKVENKEISRFDDLSKISFIMIFMYYLDIYLKDLKITLEKDINNNNLNYWIDFIFALKIHNLNYWKGIKELVLKEVIINYNFINIESFQDVISAVYISDIDSNKDLNEDIMDRVYVLYKLYPNKKEYRVKEARILGLEKNIEMKNIPKEEIARMNSWIRYIDLYYNRPNTWEEYFLKFKKIRKLYSNIIDSLIYGIEHLYKTEGDISRLFDTKITNKSWGKYDANIRKLERRGLLEPKIVHNKFGLTKRYVFFNESMDENNNYENKENKGLHNYYINYDRRFKNFFFQRNELIKKLINKDYNQRLIHISMINLIDSLENLNLLISKIKQDNLNRNLIDLDDLNYEFNKLQLLNIYWFNMISTNRVYRSNSLEYDSKELLKKKRRLIDDIFKEIEKEYVITYSDYIIDIEILDHELETLLKKIYTNIRKIFIDKNENIYEYIFFIGYIDWIKINVIYRNFAYSSSYKFTIKDIFYSNNFQEFYENIMHRLNKNMFAENIEENKYLIIINRLGLETSILIDKIEIILSIEGVKYSLVQFNILKSYKKELDLKLMNAYKLDKKLTSIDYKSDNLKLIIKTLEEIKSSLENLCI